MFPDAMIFRLAVRTVAVAALFVTHAPHATSAGLIDSPYLADAVTRGELPPLAQRIPANPSTVAFTGDKKPGFHGGRMRMLMGKEKDIRMLSVYGYARLVAFTPELTMVPDLLASVDVVEGREFTLRLREDHRWSDGAPFTAEDFRFWWQDVANNETLFPHGPPVSLLVNGKAPEVEFPDALTVVYRWNEPNPGFLPALAGARPLYIYAPKHYLAQYHNEFGDKQAIEARRKELGKRNWAGLFFKYNKSYKQTNVSLPTLQPWVNTVQPPSERFLFVRNPYFHRIDGNGRQLPYIDEVEINIASGSLVPAKTGAGESDLQARYLRLDNVPFLKQGEQRNDFNVRLWSQATGSHISLYPNLNSTDTVWRDLVRDVRFRRALSLLVNRAEINQVVYFGLVSEGGDSILDTSPLHRPEYRSRWASFDPVAANKLLDEMGLTKRNKKGLRLMPDGRPMEVIIQSAGESTEETDVLELIHDSWLKGGIKLFTRPSQREVFRDRVYSGNAMIAIWSGIPNGVATAELSPHDFVPSSQEQYQWSKWGQYVETKGGSGIEPDLPAATQLIELGNAWRNATSTRNRTAIWHEILDLHSDQVFTIGTIAQVPQPVVVANALQNVPAKGVYNWNPGAFFGMYRPDTFWFTEDRRQTPPRN